jgi:iron complex outermembrane recepter protein
VVAYELGYRATPHPRLSLDAAAYYNDYQHLRSMVAQPPVVTDTLIVVPLLFRNDFRAHTYGGEISLTVAAARGWHLRANYSLLEMTVEPRSSAPAGAATDVAAGRNPAHQASLWSSFDLPHGIELDAVGRYVGELEPPAPARPVPDYFTADAKVTWWATSTLRVGLVGQDLLQPRHVEFEPPQGVTERRQVPRRVSAFLAWRF